jgi:hypothetical protein
VVHAAAPFAGEPSASTTAQPQPVASRTIKGGDGCRSALQACSAALLILGLAACGGGRSSSGDLAIDLDRDLVSTSLDVDVATQEASAHIVVAPSASSNLSLRIGDLDILDVSDGRTALRYRIEDADGDPGTPGRRIDIATGIRTEVVIRYRYHAHAHFDGWSTAGYTFLWPYYCENLFPCKTSPADGSRFDLALRNVPAGLAAIYPEHLTVDAPSYQLAWSIADYRWLELGTTPAGTVLKAAFLSGRESAATTGTRYLRDEFAWYESMLGPYPLGGQAASVEVDWGPGAYGGMEHHPYWHVSSADFADPAVHAHEAAHGWFGDSVRIACWEDLVLSEGTASYLAAASIGAIEGAAREAAMWDDYRARLAAQTRLGDHPARPAGCEPRFDVKTIYDAIPYYRGALFLAAVERSVGRQRLLAVLREFAAGHRGQAATMQDLIDAIRVATGFDPAPQAQRYLAGLGAID